MQGGALQVSPDWHGWLHYMHDIKGDQTQARFGKPFKMQHRVNPTFLRPCAPPPGCRLRAVVITRLRLPTPRPLIAGFGIIDGDETHKPPGAATQRQPKQRGRLGPKYESWDPNGESAPSLQRNYADNAKTLHLP